MSEICNVDSRELDEMGWCGRLGLGKYLGLPQHDFSHLVISKMLSKIYEF